VTFRIGDRVHQHAFGAGDIIDVNANHITIAFDDGVTRKFATSIVQLQPSIAPRPVPATPKARRRRVVAPAVVRPES
jgi:preprotein translocase subunit YajC